ncbi:MAG: PaaI family thioesterase [Thermodesulfobacteriota bacterium]
MSLLNPDYVRKVCEGISKAPYFELLSMSLKSFDIGSSVLEIELQGKHLQPFGFVHGGVFCSIIDAAAFWALWAELDETNGITSVDLKLNYLAPAQHGRLTAVGRRIKLGKTLGLADVEVTDAAGKVVAHGSSTLMVIPGFKFQGQDGLPSKFLP